MKQFSGKNPKKVKTELNHIYWFAPYNLTSASTRYRGFYPTELLAQEFGISSDFLFPTKSFKGILTFIKVYLSILFFKKKQSVIVIQKVCSNRIYAKLLKLLVALNSRDTLYDIDDAEYLRQNSNTLHFFLRKCQAVSVGSKELKRYCEAFNKKTNMLTSPVIEHDYRKENKNEIPHIGWVGDLGNGNKFSKDFSHKTAMFNILFPQLKQLNQPFKLSLYGVTQESDIKEIKEYFKHLPNVEVNIPKNLNWEDDQWIYSEIKKFDIGVSPLTNHLFNISKSAFKVKQYLSVGVPAVASDIGENRRFIKQGETGILCYANEDFITAINSILDLKHEEYFNLSKNAFYSKEAFSLKKYCEEFIEIYNQTLLPDSI